MTEARDMISKASTLSGATNRPRKVNRHVRRWVPYTGAVILMLLIGFGLWPKPVPVETSSAEIGFLRVTVNEEGKTRIHNRYVVAAPVTGQLHRIPFKAGAEVKAGETVVAVLDPAPPALLDARTRTLTEARRDTAAANVEKAGVSHSFARSELRRLQQLFSEKTVSEQDLENAQLREATAMKDLAAAESTLRQVEAELAEFQMQPVSVSAREPQVVKAPVTGRVLKVFEENARVVTVGTPLIEIGDLSDLEVVVEVLSRDGAVITPGTRVEFEQWGGTKPLEGRVRLVEPAAFTKISALGVEEQRVNVVADLLTPVEERGNLGDNFRVEARIVVWEGSEILKVPVGALFRQGEDWAAFVIEGRRARLCRIKAGVSSGTETQIIDGLKPGEQVILYPGSRVKDGQRIRPISI